ncbi:MAG: hypothetical protein HGA70_01845 [Chlorobiaceae bacterium]|nr:hypothetical protein [Chlorobiaceae bacterium]
MSGVKPYRITVEWNAAEDFYFKCDYESSDVEKSGEKSPVNIAQTFPCMTNAMGNVLRKLRREHISFPLFLVSIAFNHRNLLSEIDRLLHLLHCHLEKEQGNGTFSCYVSSKNLPFVSSSLE